MLGLYRLLHHALRQRREALGSELLLDVDQRTWSAGLDVHVTLFTRACAAFPHRVRCPLSLSPQKEACAKKEKVEHDVYAPLHACGVMIRDLAAKFSQNSCLDETVTKLIQIWACARASGMISRAVQPALRIYVLGIRMTSLFVEP